MQDFVKQQQDEERAERKAETDEKKTIGKSKGLGSQRRRLRSQRKIRIWKLKNLGSQRKKKIGQLS